MLSLIAGTQMRARRTGDFTLNNDISLTVYAGFSEVTAAETELNDWSVGC
jgi:hypothetical protein